MFDITNRGDGQRIEIGFYILWLAYLRLDARVHAIFINGSAEQLWNTILSVILLFNNDAVSLPSYPPPPLCYYPLVDLYICNITFPVLFFPVSGFVREKFAQNRSPYTADVSLTLNTSGPWRREAWKPRYTYAQVSSRWTEFETENGRRCLQYMLFPKVCNLQQGSKTK